MPRQGLPDARFAARADARDHGNDGPAIADWTWPE
jgi:xylulose-5-phosphate/fructose-6-phosphate phosphoketolase